MAIASPPSVIVFKVTPNLSKRMIAVSKDRGMAVREMNAVRKCPRKRNSTTPTNTPPSSNECLMLAREVSINVAGRCNPGYSFTSAWAKTGLSSSSALSTASVASMVFAPYWLESAIKTPGRPWIKASPNRMAAASCTTATSRNRTR